MITSKMSTENQLNLDEELHYIYDQDLISRYNLQNVLYSDNTKIMLINGQYFLTDNQEIFFQTDSQLTSYYIDNNPEAVVVNDDDESSKNLLEGATTEIVQFVEEDNSGGEQIIYYTDNNELLDPSQQELIQEQQEQPPEMVENLEGIQDEQGNIYPFKRIKYEVSLDELMKQDSNQDFTIVQTESTPIEYTQEDEQMIENHDDGGGGSGGDDNNIDKNEELEFDEMDEQVDLSKITGKNLITGQTVTLHSYMEKLKKKLNTDNISGYCKKFIPPPPPSTSTATSVTTPTNQMIIKSEVRKQQLDELLDKKIPIGKTKNGKTIVGKVIHVGRKDVQDTPQQVNGFEDIDDEEEIEVTLQRQRVSPENLEQVCRTLSGVMEMESVQKKLENRNILVRLIEKHYLDNNINCIKKVSYCWGYMEKDLSMRIDNNSSEQQQQETEENNIKVERKEENEEEEDGNIMQTQEIVADKWNFILQDEDNISHTTSTITIIITYKSNNIKNIRVNLNPGPTNICSVCLKTFKSSHLLRQHLLQIHNICDGKKICEICGEIYDDIKNLIEHRKIHIEEGKLFLCKICERCFTTETKLQRHLPIHDVYLRPLECSVCKVRCATEWSLKKHLLTHTGIKPFACDICYKQFSSEYDVNFHKRIHYPDKHFVCNICMRTFSRHSNLVRHKEIHKSSGASYKCDICLCSYNYISSLTRHMVQNHLDAGFKKNGKI